MRGAAATEHLLRIRLITRIGLENYNVEARETPAFAEPPSLKLRRARDYGVAGANQRELENRLRPLSLEVERAFFERINVTDHQNRNEAEHAPENDTALFDRVSVNHRPWIHEHDLQ